MRKYREEQYEKLLDADYERRGWNSNGVPGIEFLKKIGMDLPELIEAVSEYQQEISKMYSACSQILSRTPAGTGV